jgi:hypothetical protein
MKRSPRGSQEQNDAPIPETINHRLHLYSLAASAAGVGLLALGQPASAQVVYTPVHITVTGGDLFLDLNCGPNINFWLADINELTSYGDNQELEIQGSTNASVLIDNQGPAVLAAGSVIGSSRNFRNVARGEHVLAWAYTASYYGIFSGVNGNWAHAKQSFLGLKFDISGQAHYGWAEMSVLAAVDKNRGLHVNATLTGYAYQDVPGQSIKAGQKTDDNTDASAAITSPQKGSLRALARGRGGCPDNDR